MVAHAEQVGPNRFRETWGRCLEEFEAGQIFEHRPGRTITESDNIQFSLLTMNAHPLHCDTAFSANSEFGQPLVNSCLTLAIVAGMTVGDISAKAIANLGWKDVQLLGPVFVGDTIYAETEIMAVRESASRPNQGIVTCKTTGMKADGSVFMTFERSALIPKKGFEINYELSGPAKA